MASNGLASILEKFSDNLHKQELIVKVVKKNFLYARNFKKR